MTGTQHNILVLIPAFNEQESIPHVLDAVAKQNSSWDILVVNDGSSDQTEAVVRDVRVGAQVMTFPFNVGIGSAMSLGFFYARNKGYDAVIRVDADGQHDVGFMQNVLAPVLNDETDISIGSRFIGPFQKGYQSSFVRRIGINFFARLITLLIRQKITDPTSGFNAFSKRAIGLFAQYYPLDYPEPEAIVLAKRAGLRVKEVPVQMNERLAGSSSIRYIKTLYYMINVTMAIMLNYLRPKKTL